MANISSINQRVADAYARCTRETFTIVNVCCGTGRQLCDLIPLLKPRLCGIRFIAIDPQADALKECERAVAETALKCWRCVDFVPVHGAAGNLQTRTEVGDALQECDGDVIVITTTQCSDSNPVDASRSLRCFTDCHARVCLCP